MKALITGASSGIGREMAKILSEMGYDIIAVARRREKMQSLREEIKTDMEIMCLDVTREEDIKLIGEKLSEVDVFINNAGFGVFGEFSKTSLEDEMKMLDTNVRAVHMLTKYALEAFRKRNSGYIMNVSSLAAFFPGPLFASYYATKSYVLRLTESIYEELRREKSKVRICVLCPGPVKTGFEEVAGVSFGNGNEKGSGFIIADKRKVSEYAIKMMFSGKLIIIPGILMKTGVFFRRIFSEKMLCRLLYALQSKKIKK